jgi:hypothetical protein
MEARFGGLLALALVLASLIVLPASVLNVPETTGTFETANTEGWLPGWEYRRAVIIDNTANPITLADYQVLVVVNTATLISEGKMRGDCGDIRFTDEDEATIIPHWIEWGCNTNSTRIWIRVPSIPGGSTKTVYMYYGNIFATSASNSTAVWGKGVYFVDGRDNYYVALILSVREWASPTSGTLIPGTQGNDVGASVTLPRSATIYGVSVSAVYVTSNGFIRWDNVADNRRSSYVDTANKMIAPHWDDLRTETTYRPDGGVYLIQGSDYYGAYFGFRWRAVYYYSTEDWADFEVLVLLEQRHSVQLLHAVVWCVSERVHIRGRQSELH